MCKKIFCLFLLAAVGLTACSGETYQDDHVYIVEQGGGQLEEDNVVDWLDVKNTSPFQEDNSGQQKLSAGQVFLTASADGQFLFYEELAAEQDVSVLTGTGRVLVNLYVLETETQTAKLIAENRPYISDTGWNRDQTMVAFHGEEMLTIYDIKKQKIILEEDMKQEAVSAFFWSPLESRKLYLEQAYNTVGLLYYMEPQKKAELYETTERLYDKAKLDEQYYYGTRWGITEEKEESVYTVITNEKKETVKVIGKGSYRDHYLRSVLLSGKNNFGLTYIANINQVNKSVRLTEEYVYDAKFIAGGRCLYITADNSLTGSQYQLHLINSAGEEIGQWSVSGSSVLLSEDGKTGYGSGPEQEVIDFSQIKISRRSAPVNKTELEQALTGAAAIYARLSLSQAVAQSEQERFYANLEGLQQLQQEEAADQQIQLTFQTKLLMVSDNEQGKLCVVALKGFNSQQQSVSQNLVFQMIEQNGTWYVHHFETEEHSEVY